MSVLARGRQPNTTTSTAILLLFLVFSGFVLPSAMAARIGLFMGTFAPPHQGMRSMIEDARTRLQLDTLFVIPVPDPVDRPEAADLRHRLAMVRLLTRDLPYVTTLSETDLRVIASRGGNLFAALHEDIQRRHADESEMFQIVGEDALPKLIAKHQLPSSGERRTLVAYPRRGFPVTRHRALEALERAGRFLRLAADIPELSGAEVRAQLKRGEDPGPDRLAPDLSAYIRREGLYGLDAKPLGKLILQHFEPAGYMAKPVLLHSPTTDTSFVPAHLESILSTDAPRPQDLPGLPDSLNPSRLPRSPDSSDRQDSMSSLSSSGSPDSPTGPDFPPALDDLLRHRAMQVVVFQAPTTDALDWLETQGWRALYGYVPPPGDDRPMLFFGRQGSDWYLFITGLFDSDRFARLVADLHGRFRRWEIPAHRLTALVPVQLSAPESLPVLNELPPMPSAYEDQTISDRSEEEDAMLKPLRKPSEGCILQNPPPTQEQFPYAQRRSSTNCFARMR